MSKLSFLTNFPKVADSFNWHKCWMTIEAGKNSPSEIYETGPNQIPMGIILWLRKTFFTLHKGLIPNINLVGSTLRNKTCYHSLQNILFSCLLSKKRKTEIHKTIILC